MYQPFELVMEKSGVKTRSSEQAMVPVEAYISMVTGSSLEEELSVTSEICASSDSIVCSEDLVITPEFSITVSNG